MLPPPPPRTQASSQGTEIHVARDVIPTQNIQGSGPVLASNEEILTLFGSVQEQMRQQQETNQMLMREIQLLKSSSRRPIEDTVTPLQPRSLNFSSALYTEDNRGNIIPSHSQSHIPEIPSSVRVSTVRIPGYAPGCAPGYDQNHQAGNLSVNTSIPVTNNLGSLQDAGVTSVITRELQKLKDMISSVPGIVQPIPEVSRDSHNISRFAHPICDAEIPKRFQTPNMKLYDGTTDPEEHIAQYRERMEINPIPPELKEACLCKGFGSTLTGSALTWLLNVPPHSITSFCHLVNLFNSQFSCSRSFEKLTSDLYRITQGPQESLRDYVNKFSRESLDIPHLDVATSVQAFKMGLQRDSQFYQDLVMNPCRNLDEARNRALRYIRLEDDKKMQEKMNASSTYESTNRKSESSHKPYRSRPYDKNENKRVNVVQDEDPEEYPELSEYCFSVNIPELMYAMQGLGDKARWPRKNQQKADWKDKSKWCAFHEDFGHVTEDCIALRKEISYLLSKGYLKDLLGRKRNKGQDTEKDPERAASPPADAKIINFIFRRIRHLWNFILCCKKTCERG
ncbi:putative retrotransposon gag domain-containing protein [Helianthus annuus]|nr:putative retrotransposon gag domain-containing protein [Helianthus annuus]